MNKILSFILLAGVSMAFSACSNEEEDLFSSSAAQRLEEARAADAAALCASPNGWAMEYYPTTEPDGFTAKGYLMFAKFTKNNSVLMAMQNAFSYNEYIESSSNWDIILDNGPVLTFNTYNDCLHKFCEPEDLPESITGTNKNEQGLGAEGDYEFIVLDASENDSEVMLKGKKRGTYVRLTRVDEGISYKEYLDYLQAGYDKWLSSSAPNYLLMTLGSEKLSMYDFSNGLPNIYPLGGDAILERNICPYLLTYRGGDYYLRFRDAMDVPGGGEVQEFKYVAAADRFEAVNGKPCYISGPVPADFVFSSVEAGHKWQMNRNSEMSDALKGVYEEAYTGFRAVKYTLNNLQFTSVDGKMLCSVSYRNDRNQNTQVRFVMNIARSENGVAVAYVEPENEGGANILAAIPSLADLLKKVSGDFSVSSVSTGFNLSTVKLVAADDLWVNVAYIN